MTSKATRRARKQARIPATRLAAAPRRSAVPRVRTPRAVAPLAGRHVLLGSARRLYAAVAGAALLVGALLVVLSLVSAHRGTTSAPPTTVAVAGRAEVAGMLKGVPQRGNVLGAAHAPVQLVEYTDLQCPYCAQFSVAVLPTLIRDYVRPGDVQIEFRGLAFLGPGSVSALRTATAARQQGRMWNVAELLFVNQGPENAWVTEDLLRSIVTAAGLDATRVLGDRSGAAVSSAMERWQTQAQAGGVTGTPMFFVGPRGGTLEKVPLTALSVDQFRTALDGALGR